MSQLPRFRNNPFEDLQRKFRWESIEEHKRGGVERRYLNTALTQDLIFYGQPADSGETIALEGYRAELLCQA